MDNPNIKFKKNNSSQVKYIYINKKNNKIYKKYKNKHTVNKIKEIYNKIKIFDFVPRMEFKLDDNIIIEDYYSTRLGLFNKPLDYIYQLLNIDNSLKNHNIYHNDYKFEHFFLYNGKIKLIDWNNMTIGKPLTKFFANNNIKQYIFYYSINYIISFILLIISIYLIIKHKN